MNGNFSNLIFSLSNEKTIWSKRMQTESYSLPLSLLYSLSSLTLTIHFFLSLLLSPTSYHYISPSLLLPLSFYHFLVHLSLSLITLTIYYYVSHSFFLFFLFSLSHTHIVRFSPFRFCPAEQKSHLMQSKEASTSLKSFTSRSHNSDHNQAIITIKW